MSAIDVVTVGETMLRLSSTRTGALPHVPTMALGMGGAESNVAVGLSRLGLTTAWISRLGADSAGDLIERELRAEGVRVCAARDSDAATGLMLKERPTPDSVSVHYYRAGSAASRMSPNDLSGTAKETLREANLLHLTGITPALSESCRDLTRALLEQARKWGIPVSFDLNFRSRLWSSTAAGQFYREVMPLIDLVFAGEDEASLATEHPGDARTLAHGLVELGASHAVIKRGPHGALALVDGAVYERDAIAITAVDTVGAGDGFVAGYLAAYVAKEAAEECLALAVATGAFACLSEGDWEGAPRRRDLALLSATEPVSR